MSTQLSPDGRWFWDGQQWRPVQPGPPPEPPRPRGRTGLVVLLVVLVVLVVAAPVGVLLYRERQDDTATTGPGTGGSRSAQPTSPSAPAETIRPGEPVTKERLARVPAAAFYWDVLQRQMTRPVSVITSAFFSKPAEFAAHRKYFAHQTGIDHRTKKFSYTSSSYYDGKPDSSVRCVGGKRYYRSSSRPWGPSVVAGEDCVKFTVSNMQSATDNIVASGLNADQAAKVIAKLRDEYDKFAHPAQPTLITANGRTYIRQVVEYKPMKLADGHYWGQMIFTWAFKASGLDPLTWPWYAGFGGGEGLHAVYYLDPKTLLPAAMTSRTTPILDDSGNVEKNYAQTKVFNYRFPAILPTLTLADTKPVSLSLPEGWRITP